MEPVRNAEELERAFVESWALVYKHSTRCAVSSMAWREVAAFRKGNPGANVFVVHVVEQRDLSNAVAARTGVRHASPQAILLENGRVAWHASHEGVTAEALEALLPASAPR
jgi:bacillithiol system protein YtxJ